MLNAWLSRCRDSEAFTLVEVMVSTLILTIVVSVVMLALADGRSSIVQSARKNQAMGLASTIAEYIKNADTSLYGQAFTVQLPDTLAGQTAVNPAVSIPASNTDSTGQLTGAFRYSITDTPITVTHGSKETLVGYDYTIQVYFGDSQGPLGNVDCQVNTD